MASVSGFGVSGVVVDGCADADGSTAELAELPGFCGTF